MRKFDTLIIGSGLGGLECAYILARHGQKVCVVEKNHSLGGCLQSFKRGDNEYDTGFHYIGGLGQGQILHNLFSYFNLMNLPWHQLDSDGYNEVILKDKSYLFANGYENFAHRLEEYFPGERPALERYAFFLKSVGEEITGPLMSHEENAEFRARLFSDSAYGFLHETIKNEELLNVISGDSLKLELHRDTLPLYIFAQINSSFVQSAWRLCGRGSMIADSLAAGIRKMGGEIIVNSPVVQLIEKEGKISEIEILHTNNETVKNGATVNNSSSETERIAADNFISDLHPEITLDLIKDSHLVRPVFRHRIKNLGETYGMFTVNLALKHGRIPYRNRNIYYYSPEVNSPWDIAEMLGGKMRGILISYQVPHNYHDSLSSHKGTAPDCAYAEIIDLLAPMSFAEVEKWKDTTVGRRGEDYKELKREKAKECIELAERCIPGLKDSILSICTSSPLTYMNYTGTVEGAAYGIRKDCNNLLGTLLAPKTPVPNLFFTGQNLNLHGILGVSITSFLTCSALIGLKSATEGLDLKLDI
jgi:all-trans-retinol 13,14-reductase